MRRIVILFIFIVGLFNVGTYASTRLLVEKNDGTVDTLYKEIINRITYEDFENGVSVSGEINGCKFVDLGLPSGRRWATKNLGAELPTDKGGVYAWGETDTKEDYTWKTYAWCKNKVINSASIPLDFSKYNNDSFYGVVDNMVELEGADDAATINLGKKWCTPTYEDLVELYNGCNWTKVSSYEGGSGYGYVGVSKTNGNLIFLPMANSQIGTTKSSTTKYLSSTRHSSWYRAYSFSFDKDEEYVSRYVGMPIRPVVLDGNKTYTISFYSKDSSLVESQTVMKGESVIPPDGPEVECYSFVDWGRTNFDDIRNDLNLYARYEYSCAQTVSGEVDGYDYVDLGLPSGTKWATQNVGAASPTEFGLQFSWGEVETKNTFDYKTYKWGDGGYDIRYMTKYSISFPNTLYDEDDAATANWGNKWCTPTDTQMNELYNGCVWISVSNYEGSGVSGMKGTSKYNGNIIFIRGSIWTSSISDDKSNYAKYINLSAKNGVQTSYRFNGNYVRPVVKK